MDFEMTGSLIGWLSTFSAEDDWIIRDDLKTSRELVDAAVSRGLIEVEKLKRGCSGFDSFRLLPSGRLYLLRQKRSCIK